MESVYRFNFEEIEKLRKNLLDMSLRNNLLNFKPRRRSIEIYDEDIVSLFDLIVLKETKMQFYSKEHIEDELKSKDDSISSLSDNFEEIDDNTWDSEAEVKASHLDKFLQTLYTEEELRKRLTFIYRENKTNIEEQGYNNFFLALGFLEWKDIDYSEKTFTAPLILVPMTIERPKVSSPFTVYWNGDEIRSNLSLIYKLKNQGIDIEEFEEFETKKDLVNYLKDIERAIYSRDGWKISKDIFLSNFSFKKFVMFKDLNKDNWINLNNSSVSKIFGENPEDYGEYDYDYEEISLDSINSSENYNVLDADSSQLAVLEEVKKGKNLVVEGPPGTGKSQTIVNLIAELMALNKKILFVSEKKAALDVVKSRLDDIGLGDGCLELHAKNSNKKEVLKELENTLNLPHIELKDENDFQELDEIKDELNEYVNTLHTVYKNTELTAYQLIGYYLKNKDILEKNNQSLLDLKLEDVSDLDTVKRGEIIKKSKDLKSYYDLIKPLEKNFWKATYPINISSMDIKEIELDLEKIIKSLDTYDETDENIHNLTGINKFEDLNIEDSISKLQILDNNLKLIKSEDNLDNLIEDISDFQMKSKNLDLDVLDLDLNSLDKEINELTDNIDSLDIGIDIVEKEDFKSINDDFKSKKEFIENSNLEKALKDDKLSYKLNIFKSKKDSFFKRNVSGEFKSIKKEFKTYYTTEVSDDQIANDLDRLIEVNDDLSKLRNKILAYANSNSNLNDDKILIESQRLISWAEDLNKIVSNLNYYNVSTNYKSLRNKINELIDLKELLNKIVSKDGIGKYYFNEFWNSYKSDTGVLKNRLSVLKEFNQYYDIGFFNDNTVELIDSINIDELNQSMVDLKINKREIFDLYNKLDQRLNFENSLISSDKGFIKICDFKSEMNKLLDNIDDLNYYRLFIKYSEEYSDVYTKNLINYIKLDKINSDLFVNLFYYNFAKVALTDIFSSNDILDDFNFVLHEEKLEKFKRLDKNIMQSNTIRIKEILSNNRPNLLSNVSSSSSLGILKREFSKKRKIMPVRKLLNRTSDVISLIKPCFMMSPLSIAQYLDPSVFESYFDYVIFDEASQVKIEDAVGALFRAKKYVVMGDTKQLPPTTFFEKEMDIDEEEEDDYTSDVESILHLCKNRTETKMLKWHYRSRHESLINVSNNEFYDNRLYVFPSPMKNKEDLGLKFEYDPKTEYYRGSGSNNIKEAENLVDYAFNLVRKYGDSRSIGVGTFNINQRNTILDVLEAKLKESPELEQYFNESGKDGFFVKNLENIQGDERDIILISIGYGRDRDGRLTMNFGPLNKDGGERRLNVLITRARMQCVVFCNFKSSEMRTDHNTPRGVEALKTFLYYAEEGELPTNFHTGEDFDSPFEASVYNFLTDEGYEVEKQVGCAGYKIDLAVVDKEDRNRYVLAIECDGATYHSSRSARDRDRLRQSVLEGLNWKFYRIWSTDWFHETRNAKARLLEAVEDAIKNKNNKQIAQDFESDFEPETIVKSNEDLINEELENYFEDYTYCDNSYGYGSSLTEIIKHLIKVEEPININDIYDYIKERTNEKATKKFKSHINDKLYFMDHIENYGDYYYTENFNINDLKVRKRIKPNIDRICDYEIEKAIIYTLKMGYSSSRDDLIKSASKHLGFKSVRDKIRNKFNQIINNNLNKGVLRENNGFIELVRE